MTTPLNDEHPAGNLPVCLDTAAARASTKADPAASRFTIVKAMELGGGDRVYTALDRSYQTYARVDPYIGLFAIGPELLDDAGALQSVIRACREWQSIAHPNLLKTDSRYTDTAHTYITTETVRGGPLTPASWAQFPAEQRASEALKVINAFGNILAFAHRLGLVHGKLSPLAYYLCWDGRPKLLDPGLTTLLAGGNRPLRLTSDPRLICYQSIETLLGQSAEVRSDVFSLACISYEILTGRHPFDGLTAIEARGGKYELQNIEPLQPHQFHALQRALAFNASARTASVEEFLQELNGQRTTRYEHLKTVAILLLLAGLGAVLGTFANRL